MLQIIILQCLNLFDLDSRAFFKIHEDEGLLTGLEGGDQKSPVCNTTMPNKFFVSDYRKTQQ